MQRIFVYACLAVAGLWVVALLPQAALAAPSLYDPQLTLTPGRLAQHDAGDRVATAGRTAAAEQRAAPFTEGSWTFEPLVFHVIDISWGAHVELSGAAVGTSYYFADDLALRVEAIGMRANQTGTDGWAGGAGLHGRWHYFRRDGFTLFFEGGGGMIHGSKSIPDGPRRDKQDGTNFNFTASVILGATVQLADDLHLNAAFRYMHISNARRHGLKRNPSTEGMGGHLGLIWTF